MPLPAALALALAATPAYGLPAAAAATGWVVGVLEEQPIFCLCLVYFY